MIAPSSRSGAPASHPWLFFGVLFAARTSIAYQFQSVPAVGPYLVDTLEITYGTLGLLIGSFMLPGVLLAIPGGMLDKRLGSKRVLLLGLAAMFLGGLLMVGRSPELLFAGRILSGAGAVILNVVLAKVVAERFAEQLVAVMGGFVASWPLGVALALVTLPRLAEQAGPAAALVVGALPTALCFLAIWALFRDAERSASIEPGKRFIGRLATGLALTSGLVWGFYNVSYVVIVANLPEFLALKGYSVPAAAAVTSILGWVLIVTLPGGGLIAQRMGHPFATMATCLLLVGVAVGLLVVAEGVLWWVGLLALLVGLPAGLIMALPAQSLSPEDRSVGMGLFFTAFYGCMAVLPGIAGTVREFTGTPASALLCGGAGAILAAACLLPFAALRSRALPRP